MIGLGVDMVHLPPFAKQLDDKASNFAEGCFTPGEWRYAHQQSSNDPVRHLAARYAAKEAMIKAWSSTRWGKPNRIGSVDFREIEVINDPNGRPAIRLHGNLLSEIGQSAHTQVSLSHDGDYAIATVLLMS